MKLRLFAALLAAPVAYACTEATAPDPIATVTVSASATTLTALGATAQATAAAVTAGGNAATSATVTWMSVNASVASVSTTGLITAVGNGTTNIVAMAGDVSGSVSITVSQAVATITVSPSTVPTITALGATTTLSASAVDANSNAIAGVSFTWTTASAAIASVSTGGVVTSVGNGTTTISASAGGASGTRSITVTQAATSVVITPSTLGSIDALGATVSASASVRDSRGIPVAGAAVAWSSTAPSVATVSTAGLITSVANGTTRIIAASGAVRDTLLVTVAQVASSAEITCANYANLTTVGATVQCSAALRDRLGRAMTGSFTWTSSNTFIATVSSSGLVTAVTNGDVSITAAVGSVSDFQLVRVDLSIPLGSVRTGRITAGRGAQLWDVTGGGTRASFATWVHRSPSASSTLNPTLLFSTTSSGINTTAVGIEMPWSSTIGSELYARADMPNSTANTDIIIGGGATAGEYVFGISDCRMPFTPTPLGFFISADVRTADCAIMQSSTSSGPRFVPAVTGIVTATAGALVIIEVIGPCAACGSGRLPDPVLHVFGPRSGDSFFNDDGISGTLNSRIAFTAPVTGNYTFLVSDISGRTGSFTLCAFSGCTAYAPSIVGAGMSSSVVDAGASQLLPTRMPTEWQPTLTVRRAYEALKAYGVLPADFDPSQAVLAKPKF